MSYDTTIVVGYGIYVPAEVLDKLFLRQLPEVKKKMPRYDTRTGKRLPDETVIVHHARTFYQVDGKPTKEKVREAWDDFENIDMMDGLAELLNKKLPEKFGIYEFLDTHKGLFFYCIMTDICDDNVIKTLELPDDMVERGAELVDWLRGIGITKVPVPKIYVLTHMDW